MASDSECTHGWHETRRAKRAESCPVCHEPNEPRPDLFDRDADPERWSNVSSGGVRLTWRELAENQRQELEHRGQLVTVLMDLNRCEHGRHEGDDCFGCHGPSKGNPITRAACGRPPLAQYDLRQIGHGLSGHPIIIPERGRMNDPDAWLSSTSLSRDDEDEPNLPVGPVSESR